MIFGKLIGKFFDFFFFFLLLPGILFDVRWDMVEILCSGETSFLLFW